MRIGREVAGDTEAFQEAEQEIRVPLTRRNKLDGILIQPTLYDGDGVMSRERPFENAPACHDPDEAQNRDPRQADGTQLAVERLFPPVLRRLVSRKILVVRVDENIDVRDRHRRFLRGVRTPSFGASSSSFDL